MSISQNMRDELARKRQTRGNKLARIFAHPSQLARTEAGLVISPAGETPLEAAQREATAARAAADAAKAKL